MSLPFNLRDDPCSSARSTAQCPSAEFFSVRRLLWPVFSRWSAVAASFSKLFAYICVAALHSPTSCFRIPLPAQASRQCASRALRTDNDPSSLAAHRWFLPFCLPYSVTMHAEVFDVWLSVVLHHYRCDVVELEAFFPALPGTHEHGIVPSSRIAYRTWNEASLLLVLFHVHLHVVLLARFVLLR